MAVTHAPPAARSGNLAKHRSQNPLQRRLLARFHQRIAALTAESLAGGPPVPRVLEVGCGEGFVLAALGEHLPRARYLGLELRAEALPLAAAQAPHAGLGRADALRLPLADRAADVTLCLEVLEHLPDPWAAVRELLRVTRGSVIVSVPDQPWFALANLARAKNLPTLGDDSEHLHHWRGSTFVRLLSQRAQVMAVARSFPWVIAVCRGQG